VCAIHHRQNPLESLKDIFSQKGKILGTECEVTFCYGFDEISDLFTWKYYRHNKSSWDWLRPYSDCESRSAYLWNPWSAQLQLTYTIPEKHLTAYLSLATQVLLIC
jgi:hypothetical protein